MSDWTIKPFVSLGPLRFCMRQGEPERALGELPKAFKKGFSGNVTEAYNGAGAHVYYDAYGAVEFIEAFPPSRPTYRGVDLMRTEATDVVAALSKLGLTVRDDGKGGLWFDEADSPCLRPAAGPGESRCLSAVTTRAHDAQAEYTRGIVGPSSSRIWKPVSEPRSRSGSSALVQVMTGNPRRPATEAAVRRAGTVLE